MKSIDDLNFSYQVIGYRNGFQKEEYLPWDLLADSYEYGPWTLLAPESLFCHLLAELDKLLNFSVPQSLHLKNGNNHYSSLIVRIK